PAVAGRAPDFVVGEDGILEREVDVVGPLAAVAALDQRAAAGRDQVLAVERDLVEVLGVDQRRRPLAAGRIEFSLVGAGLGLGLVARIGNVARWRSGLGLGRSITVVALALALARAGVDSIFSAGRGQR